MIYWQQLKSLLIHKWYVFLAGRWVGVPLWRRIIHDWSKFTPVEFINYARYKYGVKSIQGWAKAWLHHLSYNPHHPEHWLLSWRGNSEFYNDIGQSVAPFCTILPMPEHCVREMVADMMATSKEITGSWHIAVWLNQNGPEMHLHDKTITLIDQVMKEIGYVLTDNCDWSWIAGYKFRLEKKYDFSQGERGKFYRAGARLNFPDEEQIPVCAHCGKPIQGLENAPEIAIHCHTEMRRCVVGQTSAEWEKEDEGL